MNEVNMDWKNLGFAYHKTDYNVRCYYRDGKWGEIEVSSDDNLSIPIASTCLHYGQESFEGLKAFRCKDGKIRIFRVEENAARMQSTSRGIVMPELPTEIFAEMCKRVVKLNERFIPPYGQDASLYLRPLMLGIGNTLGVKPASEYIFCIFVSPVGAYFKNGFATSKYCIQREHDRACAGGTGRYKVGGNYAASLRAHVDMCHSGEYSCEIYLDAATHTKIDEFGAANAFFIKNGTYITPESESILPSITNKSLMQVAIDLGFKAERRPVFVEELAEMEEAGACGTAAVISPICQIDDKDTGKSYIYSEKPGPVSTQLYNRLRAIQLGEVEDIHGWNTVLD